jgi:hypothetical protein
VDSGEHITPAYGVAHAQHVDTVRAPETLVDLALHNANRHDTIPGPAITVPPLQAKLADPRPSCRNAILDAIDRLHQQAGATAFARRDIVAEVQSAGLDFARQTIYRCLRRITGQEAGSVYHDLEELGNDQLRLRT